MTRTDLVPFPATCSGRSLVYFRHKRPSRPPCSPGHGVTSGRPRIACSSLANPWRRSRILWITC
ncbi:hypothetical protein PR202_gb16274 [Eleusine coracana subsp. coracana]|uniref:Uncharacterized protein n=1 Tax=Eleusine coracana subsp. coracana TaxID=191504 RepID=A0AAV5EXQ2_ELECO|nr:hypothetical protein PR202_gb16274 [Eleusine coracana subsp. coracana]